MAFCIPQPSSGGRGRRRDALPLRWSLADPVASLLQTGRSKRSFLPRAHRPPSSALRLPSPVRFKMSQKRMTMSRKGIDAFCDYCKMRTVITQVT